jgi:hypothetical protein
MIKRISRYINSFRGSAHKQYTFVRPSKRDTEKIVRAVITRHKEALKELGGR